MRLRLLDRYVLKELLYPFVFGIAAFSSIFIASTMLFKITQYMTKYGAPLETVARLFMYNLPEVINYTFPMSMLLAALMAFGKLSGSSEITAMKAGGVSYYRIVAPVLVVGFFVSMFSMVLGFFFFAKTTGNSSKYPTIIAGAIPLASIVITLLIFVLAKRRTNSTAIDFIKIGSIW